MEFFSFRDEFNEAWFRGWFASTFAPESSLVLAAVLGGLYTLTAGINLLLIATLVLAYYARRLKVYSGALSAIGICIASP
jgi:hypothetical protein